jgi:HAE1 family hydrophobic/amphiphilic exporter-1
LPGVSTGQAIAAMEKIANEALPAGFGFEWTELALQQQLAGNTAVFIFALSVVFVFLALAAQYESWSLPLAIILIVEFARQREHDGKNPVEAVIEACRLRLRPILMTAFAFILGVLPLTIATGPGAEMRQALGTAVFAGMLGVTFFGLFLTPVFYVTLRALTRRREAEPSGKPAPAE